MFLLALPAAASVTPAQEAGSGRITGWIELDGGDLLVEGWAVQAFELRTGPGHRSSTSSRSTTIDPESGQFAFDGLSKGTYLLRASTVGGVTEPATVELEAGDDEHVVLRLEGPDPRRTLMIRTDPGPFSRLSIRGIDAVAVGPDGVVIPLRESRGNSRILQSDQVVPGAYRVEVRDRRFESVILEDLRPGTPHSVSLVGSASLSVAVVDAGTGEPLRDYELDIIYEDARRRTFTHTLQRRGRPVPPGGVYPGLVPDNVRLEARVAGRPPASPPAFVLEGGKRRSLTVRVSKGERIEGVVTDAAGASVLGVEVQLTRGRWPGHDVPNRGASSVSSTGGGMSFQASIGYRDAATETDADGRFAFTGLGPGSYFLFAKAGPFLDAVQRIDVPIGGAPSVVMEFPQAAPVGVRVHLPDGAEPGDVAVSFTSHDPSQRWDSRAHPWRSALRTAANRVETLEGDGTFGPVFVPVGAWRVKVSRVTRNGSRVDRVRSFDGRELLVERAEGGGLVRATWLEFDARESLPSVLRIALPDLDGAPVGAGSARLLPRGGVLSSSQSGVSYDPQRGWRAELHAPAGEYDLVVSSGESLWRAATPVLVEVSSRATQMDPQLRLVDLRLIDAQGDLIEGAPIACWQGDGPRQVTVTDRAGGPQVLLHDGLASIARLDPEKVSASDVRASIRRLEVPAVDRELLAGVTSEGQALITPSTRSVVLTLGQR